MLLDFNIINIIDIFLVALLLFYLYKMMKESSSLNLFVGILIFIMVWMLVSQVFKMPLLGGILDASSDGLGHMILISSNLFDSGTMVVGILIIGIIGIAFDIVFRKLQNSIFW